MDPDGLRALREAKLRALIGERAAGPRAVAVHFGDGVGLVAGDEVWALGAPDDERVLGRLLALAAGRGLLRCHLVLEEHLEPPELAGHLARRAGLLHPAPGLWQVRGRELLAVEPLAAPEPAGEPAGSEALVARLRSAGLEVVVEHGVVHGELLGLEVARIHRLDDGRVVLDVGVGRFDQAAGSLLYQDQADDEALARVITEVRRHRRAGAEPHPINRLARERWLRARILADPRLVGLRDAAPVPPVTPRRGLREPAPAASAGRDDQGGRVLVVCAVGVDLELVPTAADLAAREAPDRVMLVTPERDRLPVQHHLVGRLGLPAQLVALEGDWPV